jgi:hypothetical protein
MSRVRPALLALAALTLATRASAVDVSFSLTGATSETCTEEYDGYYYYGTYWSCAPPAPVAIAPSAPQGAGSIDFDVTGRPFGGSVALEAHQLGGDAVPAWTRTFVPEGSSGVIRTSSDSGIGPWPVPLGPEAYDSSAWLTITRFASQSDFDGTITVRWDEVQRDAQGVGTRTVRQLVYAFSALGSGSVACPGEEIFADDDHDGEKNDRDRFPHWLNGGGGVDADGATLADFCAGSPVYPKTSCRRADFRNDEPLRGNAGDCRLVRTGDPPCQPAEIFGATPLPTLRACLGLPVVDDADEDGEPDGTDRCASTPAGQAVDGDGCSAQEFCAAQAYKSCRRSDWRNDERSTRSPRDCTRTRRPRACTAATP